MLFLRMLMRSGGAVAVSLALVGLGFYGIAGLSVMVVDDPPRGLKVLAVFLLLSAFFFALLRWLLFQAIRQALRPLGAAKDATTRLASLGGRGGAEAFRTVRDGALAVGYLAARAAGGALHAASCVASRAASFVPRPGFIARPGWGRPPEPPARPAPVIPLRRSQVRKAR